MTDFEQHVVDFHRKVTKRIDFRDSAIITSCSERRKKTIHSKRIDFRDSAIITFRSAGRLQGFFDNFWERKKSMK